MEKTKYLTTPIFYANSNPHIGHLYTGLVCDLWRQVNNVMNSSFFLSSGMDEHGQKVFQSAQENGFSAKEYVDKISGHFVDFFAKYHVRYDYWVRTTDENHEKAAQYFWTQLEKNGYIYKSTYKGWYAISDENYLDVPADYEPTSPNIVWREEDCYFFKLSAFQEKLLKHYEENPDAVYPRSRYNETVGFIKQGLKDFSISRPKDRLDWGIPVPNDEDQVMYVWIDALTNYLSLIGYPDDVYHEKWPAIHVVGKDILKFHTVYWQALLMAAGVELPKLVVVHGWWLNGDRKISKSLNNAIDIHGLTEAYGGDSVRYFLLSNMTLGEDASFRDEVFQTCVNSMLSNKFGNLLLRLTGLAQNKGIEVLERCDLSEELQDFIDKTSKSVNDFAEDITLFDDYIRLFANVLDFLNNYVESHAIWKLGVDDIRKELYSLLYCFKVISVLFSGLFPEASLKLAGYFDCEINLKSALEHKDITIKESLMLFPRVTNND